MSWYVNAVLSGADDIDKLSELINKNNDNYTQQPIPETMVEQQLFTIEMVKSAFESGVLDDGAYSVTVNGHTNPEQEGDRKSLGISFSPTTVVENELT